MSLCAVEWVLRMLPKKNRITTGEIKTLTRPTTRSQQAVFTLLYFAAPKVRKLAVVVGKKVSKKAVTRNRVRRQLYALVADELQRAAPGYYLLRVQPSILNQDRAATSLQLQAAFGQITKTR